MDPQDPFGPRPASRFDADRPVPDRSAAGDSPERACAAANPYEPTGPGNPDVIVARDLDGDRVDGTDGNGAELATPLRQPPRIWPTLLSIPISWLVFMAASMVMVGVSVLLVVGPVGMDEFRDPATIKQVTGSRLGLLLMVVVPQLFLIVTAVIASILSPMRTTERLGLVRGHWPIWAWFAAAFAAPLVGMISGVVFSLFLEESDQLKEMSQIFRGHGQAGFLIPLALMIGATPAICEELFFRGFVQTRLTRSLGARLGPTGGPLLGILIASACFAAFHMDPVHVVAVFPIGLFLGWISWRSGSLFPAMMGHFLNNVISVVAVVLAPEAETDVLALPAAMISLAILGFGLSGMIAVSIASFLYGRPDQQLQGVKYTA